MIDNTKFAVFEEWSYDPPGGSIYLYYDTYFESISDVWGIVDEIIDHVKYGIGYYDEDDKEYFEDEIEGLDPSDEDGKLTIERIKNWSWDNGGMGCGCVVYAEGEEIAEAAAKFYEDYLMDDLEEPCIDPDDEENDLECGVTICEETGKENTVSVEVSVSSEELKHIAICGMEGKTMDSCTALSPLIERVATKAVFEIFGFENSEIAKKTKCIVSIPDEFQGINTFIADSIVENARNNPKDEEKVKKLLDLVSRLVETLNNHEW